MQSELGSLNQIYQDHSGSTSNVAPKSRFRKAEVDGPKWTILLFQRVIFIFDNIYETTNRHLDNPQLTFVMFFIVLETRR
jgi:hypothetical protein